VRVLVTGATGFTGGHLARALRTHGHDVWAMVRVPQAASHLTDARIPLTIGDLGRPESLAHAVKGGFDVIYNIAAVYRQAGLPESIYHQVNATAVGQLIEAAAAAGVRRVVHCSTVGVHGDIARPPANEDAPSAQATSTRSRKSKASGSRGRRRRGRESKSSSRGRAASMGPAIDAC
jgi:dihydroflavonol-4-reductase